MEQNARLIKITKTTAKGLANVLSDVSSEKRTIESQIIQAARTHIVIVTGGDTTTRRTLKTSWCYHVPILNEICNI